MRTPKKVRLHINTPVDPSLLAEIKRRADVKGQTIAVFIVRMVREAMGSLPVA